MHHLFFQKEVDRFRTLIHSPDTVEELDRTSGCKGSTHLFQFLQKFLQKETEVLQSGTASKNMQEISSLMKYFIRCANQCPKLKCAELISILLKNIVSVCKYWCEMSKQQWHSECMSVTC
uniref:Telomere-length maintenance and DNA damage repair domain-containing protein n=1 Tax=Cyprinus carpio TaxID=7962 RepID=A0A8C1T2J6_CYPCA